MRPAPRAPPGPHRRPTARSPRTTSIPRSPPRFRRQAATPASAVGLVSSAGQGPEQEDRAGTDCGQQPSWAKMASAGGVLKADGVSVDNFHRSAQARPPPTDTPKSSPAATTSQVTPSIQDFAGSLEAGV